MSDDTMRWIEAAFDSFWFNLHEGDYSQCKAIVEDTKLMDKTSARTMQDVLNETLIGRFNVN